jgi:hypothetical protein
VPDWVAVPDAAAAGEGGGDEADANLFPPPGAPEKGIVDLLKDAFSLYKRHLKVFVITAAILFVPASLVSSGALALITAPLTVSTSGLESAARRLQAQADGIASGKVDPREAEAVTREAEALAGAAVGGIFAALLGALAWAIMALIIYGITIPLINGALTIAVADRVVGGQAGWREHWSLLFRRLGPLLSALLPAAVLIAVGFFFLVLPGLALAFFFAFVPAVVLIEGVGGVAALKRSFALVKSDWLRIALVFITFGVLNWIAHFIGALLVPSRLSFVSHVVGDLVTLVLLPIPVLASVLVYLDLRRRSEGFDRDRLRGELEALRTGG